MEFLKKNKLVVIAVVVVLLVVGVGGFVFLQSRNTASQAPIEEGLDQVTKMKPEDIGLVLTPKSDGKIINLKATKLDGVKSIEYDVSYDAEVTDEGETLVVPRGVAGSPLEVDGESEISRDLDLGTCSRNVCKYDKVVSDVTFTIRVNFTNGTVGGIEAKVKI